MIYRYMSQIIYRQIRRTYFKSVQTSDLKLSSITSEYTIKAEVKQFFSYFFGSMKMEADFFTRDQ